MKINRWLPHFNNEKALIISTWEYTAFLYLAHEGKIILADSFIIERPDFTDKEERFWNIWTWSFSVWSAYEFQKQYIHTKFLATLKERIKLLEEKEIIDSIYLFSPNYTIKWIEDTLNKSHKYAWKLKIVDFWNFIHHHPFELLEKIQDYKGSKIWVPVLR